MTTAERIKNMEKNPSSLEISKTNDYTISALFLKVKDYYSMLNVVAILCESTENHGTVHLKWANSMLCELDLNKVCILKILCSDK